MKIFKPKKKLKNSREVLEFFTKQKEKDGLLYYKGGIARVEKGRVTKIYVGKDMLKNAKLNK